MAFPSTGVLEVFTGANGTDISTLTNWGILGGAADGQVNTNAASNVSASGNYVGNYLDNTTYGPDSEAFITVTVLASYFGVFARLTTPTGSYDAYQASWSASDLTAQRNDNAVQTQLGATVTLAKTAGDTLGLEVIGSTIKVYTETGGTWTERLSRADATYSAAGNIGWDLFDATTAMRLDDFGGGSVVAAAAEIPSLVMAPPIA